MFIFIFIKFTFDKDHSFNHIKDDSNSASPLPGDRNPNDSQKYPKIPPEIDYDKTAQEIFDKYLNSNFSPSVELSQKFPHGNNFIKVSSITGLVEDVDLSANYIHELKNLDNFPNLKDLNLSYNNLETLDLSNNFRFEKLTLFNNKFTSINVKNLTNLKTLSLGNNNLSGRLDLSGNLKLEEFNLLGNNKLETIVLKNKNQHEKLKKLNRFYYDDKTSIEYKENN